MRKKISQNAAYRMKKRIAELEQTVNETLEPYWKLPHGCKLFSMDFPDKQYGILWAVKRLRHSVFIDVKDNAEIQFYSSREPLK